MNPILGQSGDRLTVRFLPATQSVVGEVGGVSILEALAVDIEHARFVASGWARNLNLRFDGRVGR